MDEPLRRRTCFILALVLIVTMMSTGARAGTGSTWRGTILCTTATAEGYRSITVDRWGSLTALTFRRALAPGLRIETDAAAVATEGRSDSAGTVDAMRVLPATGKPVVVRSRVVENGYSHYRFYRDGRPWGCRVTFDEPAAVSVAKLILSGRRATLTLAVRSGQIVHLGPRKAPLAAPSRIANASADVEGFFALVARGHSIAACAMLSTDAVLIHGGPDGCVMAFESAKFLYRERYRGAFVKRVGFFALTGDSYALATIWRHSGSVRAFFIFERGRYRYLGDLVLSPIELW